MINHATCQLSERGLNGPFFCTRVSVMPQRTMHYGARLTIVVPRRSGFRTLQLAVMNTGVNGIVRNDSAASNPLFTGV